MNKIKKLSVVIPVYNEKDSIETLIKRVIVAKLPKGITKEIVVVDDASCDGTKQILKKIFPKQIKVFFRKKNQGKGAAIRRGLKEVTGEAVIIQDADLEYDPKEYSAMLEPMIERGADVVYGSRFVGSGPHRVHLFWHLVGNKLLTLLSNALTNLNLTDMETCYKMFSKKVIDSIKIKEDRFGFEPEITAKVAKGGWQVYEIGISYSGRSYKEGKKINWKDGLRTLWCILKYNLI